MERVRQVNRVVLAYIDESHKSLKVSAFGAVPTSGWKGGTLEPREYSEPPADGIQVLDFFADPGEDDMVLQVISPISAEIIFEVPTWLSGVRIIARNNHKEELLSSE